MAGFMHKLAVSLIALAASFAAAAQVAHAQSAIFNPAIDSPGYLRVAHEALAHRDRHRISEAEFIRMSREPGTIILDARSKEKFDELHVAGAINLSFPDIATESLRAVLPNTKTRILIYCNNNFRGNESAFAAKVPPASLNLSTYIALYSYGYGNVYELAPQLHVKKTAIEFASSSSATQPIRGRGRSGADKVAAATSNR